jgi:hypothetical protein
LTNSNRATELAFVVISGFWILAIFVAGPVNAALPACMSATSDLDGDGYGWENNTSCIGRPVNANMPPAHPSCATADSDADGDGFGWENNRTCIVEGTGSTQRPEGTTPTDVYPVCSSASSDPDGDGYGWENNRSCLVQQSSAGENPASTGAHATTHPVCADSASDPDGDGYGWENNQSCITAATEGNGPARAPQNRPVCVSALSDPDGDGYGWENNTTCLVDGLSSGDSDPAETPPDTDNPNGLCITEFAAADQAVIADQDGDFPDWIELHNSGSSTIDLDGWCLTDDKDDNGKWCFDSGAIAADGYLVVFASDNNRMGPEWHTNFKLKKGGEYLGLYNPAGNEVCAYSPEFPQQYDQITYGIDANGSRAYFGQPSPGLQNDDQSISTPITMVAQQRHELDVGASREIEITAMSADGGTVTFDGPALPTFASLTDNGNGTATLHVEPDSSGQFEMLIAASNGVFKEEITLTLVVLQATTSVESINQLSLQWGDNPLILDETNARLFMSLGEQYANPRQLTAPLTYRYESAGYSIEVDGQPIASGATLSKNLSHGDTVAVDIYQHAALVSSLDIVISNLPILEIFAEQIVDEPKLPGTARWIDGSLGIDYGNINIGIETRGGTSQQFDKKPFAIEFRESDSEKGIDVQLLGLRDDDDWIADAAFRDQTFARNIVSHDLHRAARSFAYRDADGNERGQSTITGGLAEVILNSGYHGVYMIHERVDRKLLGLEKIQITEDESGERWDLVDLSLPENSSVLYKANDNRSDLSSDSLGEYEQKYPDEDDVQHPSPLADLIEFTNETSDQEFIATIGAKVDLESLMDYWMVTLVSSNNDALWKNHYIARNLDQRWIFVPWDHDATFGMMYTGAEDKTHWRNFQYKANRLLERVVELPEIGFNRMAMDRWSELRDSIYTADAITARFVAYEEALDRGVNGAASSPRQRNLDRWPGTGNTGAGQPELGQSSYIRAWLERRLEFVDEQMQRLPE